MPSSRPARRQPCSAQPRGSARKRRASSARSGRSALRRRAASLAPLAAPAPRRGTGSGCRAAQRRAWRAPRPGAGLPATQPGASAGWQAAGREQVWPVAHMPVSPVAEPGIAELAEAHRTAHRRKVEVRAPRQATPEPRPAARRRGKGPRRWQTGSRRGSPGRAEPPSKHRWRWASRGRQRLAPAHARGPAVGLRFR